MVWKFVNAAGGLVAGLDGEVSARRPSNAASVSSRCLRGVEETLRLRVISAIELTLSFYRTS